MRFQTPPVVKNLLIINILFFLAQSLLPFGESITDMLGLHYWGSGAFEPYQFITYMFLHGNVTHLVMNMFALWMFGRIAEYDMGGRRFLLYYMITGVGAALFYMVITEFEFSAIRNAAAAFINTPTPEGFSMLAASKLRVINMEALTSFMDGWYAAPDNGAYASQAVAIVREALTIQLDHPMVGASGAIFGILLAFGLMHPNDQIMLLIPPIPMKAKYFVIGYGVLELVLGISNRGGTIAHFAHVGGMVWGILLLWYWKKRGKIYY